MLREALKNGKGLEKLRALIRAQGGDDSVCDHPETLADAPIIMPLCLPESGYIRKMDTTLLGYASQSLGAGRKQKTDGIDPQVGFIMHKRIGDAINEDKALCTIYARDEKTLSEARDMILRAVTVSSAPCDKQQLLYAVVTPEGVTSLSE